MQASWPFVGKKLCSILFIKSEPINVFCSILYFPHIVLMLHRLMTVCPSTWKVEWWTTFFSFPPWASQEWVWACASTSTTPWHSRPRSSEPMPTPPLHLLHYTSPPPQFHISLLHSFSRPRSEWLPTPPPPPPPLHFLNHSSFSDSLNRFLLRLTGVESVIVYMFRLRSVIYSTSLLLQCEVVKVTQIKV